MEEPYSCRGWCAIGGRDGELESPLAGLLFEVMSKNYYRLALLNGF